MAADRRGFGRGELLLVVLKLLEERTMAEGELLDELHALLSDEYRLTPGGVLAALEALEAEGLVRAAVLHGAPVYAITQEGAHAVRVRAGAPVLASLSGPERSGRATEDSVSHVLEHVTVLFTDIVGSTELFDRLGDAAAHGVQRRHFALLREAIRRHGGREVKCLGDGLMVVFAGARGATACAVAMHRAVSASDDPLGLRVGIASGEAVCEDEDYFGRPVILARRLCDRAAGGEVLMAEPPPGKVAGLSPQPLEPLELKGLSQPVTACAMRPESLTRTV
jgi:class 3 adenylate cyclase